MDYSPSYILSILDPQKYKVNTIWQSSFKLIILHIAIAFFFKHNGNPSTTTSSSSVEEWKGGKTQCGLLQNPLNKNFLV